MKFILTGMPGCGKSALGRNAARTPRFELHKIESASCECAEYSIKLAAFVFEGERKAYFAALFVNFETCRNNGESRCVARAVYYIRFYNAKVI